SARRRIRVRPLEDISKTSVLLILSLVVTVLDSILLPRIVPLSRDPEEYFKTAFRPFTVMVSFAESSAGRQVPANGEDSAAVGFGFAASLRLSGEAAANNGGTVALGIGRGGGGWGECSTA